MKKILKARSICWVVFSAQGTHCSTPSLKHSCNNIPPSSPWIILVNLLAGVNEVDHQGADGEDEDQGHQDLSHPGLS